VAADTPRPIPADELRNRFQYHPPQSENDVSLHEDVRHELLSAAETLNAILPDGREKALVVTHLEEAMFWANAALARARGRS
jgi:hypothetical protein